MRLNKFRPVQHVWLLPGSVFRKEMKAFVKYHNATSWTWRVVYKQGRKIDYYVEMIY